MPRKLASALALMFVMALLMAACGGDNAEVGGSPTETSSPTETGSPTEGSGTITIAGQEANDHGSQDVSGQDEIELEMDDFYFSPTVLQGQAGQRLTIELRNEGQAPHTFTLTEQNVDQQVEPGEDAKVSVTFPDSGELAFVCRFHQGQGMRGGLKV